MMLSCPVCSGKMQANENAKAEAVESYTCEQCGSMLIVDTQMIRKQNNISNMEEFKKFYHNCIEERTAHESTIAEKVQQENTLEVEGFCEVCGSATRFLLDMLYSDGTTPNYRERMVCKNVN